MKTDITDIDPFGENTIAPRLFFFFSNPLLEGMVVHNRSDNYQPSQWHLLVPSSSNQIRRGPDVAAAAACARQLCFFIAMMHFTERAASHRSPHRSLSCSSWSSVRNINQRYVHRSRGSNRARPKSRGPPSPSSRIDPISHLFSHEPVRKFPPHPSRRLSTLFRFRSLPSLSTFIELPLPLHARSWYRFIPPSRLRFLIFLPMPMLLPSFRLD